MADFDYYGNQLDPNAFVARTHKYILDISLTSLQLLTAQQITLRGTEMYFAIMRLMAVASDTTGLASFRCAMYTSNSDRYQAASLGGVSDRVIASCLFGTASRPAVLPVPIVIPGTASLLLDLENLVASGNDLHLVLEGVRLFPKQ